MDTEPDTDSDSEDEDVEFVPVSRPDQVPRTPCKSAAEFFAEDSPVPASGHPRAGGRAAAAASGGGAGAQGGGGWGALTPPGPGVPPTVTREVTPEDQGCGVCVEVGVEVERVEGFESFCESIAELVKSCRL